MAVGKHESPRPVTDTWITPKYIIDSLGPFDLDPCTPDLMPWETAAKRYTMYDNGLLQPWEGRVWLNPPYGSEILFWLQRMATHKNGIALIFSRTDTGWFQEAVFDVAYSILFIKGRITFCNSKGVRYKSNAGAGSCLVSYTEFDHEKLIQANNTIIKGKLLKL